MQRSDKRRSKREESSRYGRSRRGRKEHSHLHSDLFDSHVYLPTLHLGEDEYIAPSVFPPKIQHAITSMKNCTAPGPDRIKPEHLKGLPPVIVRTLAWLFTQSLSECKVPMS
ncbi:hypothetical protein V3C99_012747 [Haemonchus contortus]|uniref:Reverse transcriptase domain-containing protein n=1 Tax=Haemonchus contortus TaxID=6289 RepID=A0A7I4Y252_HAECO